MDNLQHSTSCENCKILEDEIERLDKAFDWSAQRYARLEAKLEHMTDIANKEHASSAHIAMRNGELEDDNERLRELFSKGQEMDESRTWFWDDDIVTALGGK